MEIIRHKAYGTYGYLPFRNKKLFIKGLGVFTFSIVGLSVMSIFQFINEIQNLSLKNNILPTIMPVSFLGFGYTASSAHLDLDSQ